MFLMPLSTKCFLCNSNIGNVLVTSEFFFYWKLLYTIAHKVIKKEYIGWMFFVEIHNKIGKYFLLLVLPLE